MQRTALDVMKIAAQAKTKSSNFEAGKYQRPADFNKLVSIITVMNLKGGVGKSTIAVNLACELAAQRFVVVVDADSQGTAADWARRGELPARVEALPLDTDDEVGPWFEQVLNTGADHVIVDCPPHLGPPHVIGPACDPFIPSPDRTAPWWYKLPSSRGRYYGCGKTMKQRIFR